MNKVNYFFCFVLLLSVLSCSLFNNNDVEKPIARVNEHYLTGEDITAVLKRNTTVDSSIFVQKYINEWATEQLLLDGARRNIPQSVQDNFDNLVSNYKGDLYTKYYENMLLNRALDSVVHIDEAKQFYEENKNSFLLNEPLVQFRFIAFDNEDNVDNDIKKMFKNGSSYDLQKLDSLKFKYKNHFLNDSSWIKTSKVVEQVNVITVENKNRLLKKTNFVQLRDSLGLYLVAVKERLDRNDIAPLEFIRPTINQIIINKRKLALIKKLEKEIKDDAIKNKQFEIYN